MDSFNYWTKKLKSLNVENKEEPSSITTSINQNISEEIITTDDEINLNLNSSTAEHCLVVGETTSGKTTLINHIIRQNIHYFKYVIVFCKSSRYENDYVWLDPSLIFSKIDINVLKKIILMQENAKKADNNSKRICVILDDVGGENFHGSDKKFWEDFITNARHRNIVFLCSVQNLTMINPLMRNNFQNYFVTYIKHSAYQSAYALMGGNLKDWQFEKALEKHCKEKFIAYWFYRDCKYDYILIKQKKPKKWKISFTL